MKEATSFKSIFRAHRIKLSMTLLLIVLEAGLSILFPLFIGFAIDGAINGQMTGIIQLGILAFSILIVGVGRRVFDSRFYAKVYQDIGMLTITKMDSTDYSIKTARLGMIGELIEFLENSLPEIIASMIGLVGVIVIIASLNLNVFYGSMIVLIIVFLVYWLSSKKTIEWNSESNNELEKQVNIISSKCTHRLGLHLKALMKWNIKLSDLEAFNFSISWMVMIIFLGSSILIAIDDGILKFGALFSLIMYVFQYIENVMNLPFFYQNWLRLREIQERIEGG